MAASGVVRRGFRFFRALGVTAAASGLIMGLSFLVTLSVVRDRSAAQHPPAFLLEQGEELRILSNELLQLGASYVTGVPKSGLAPAPSVAQWVDRTFLPRLQTFRVKANRQLAVDPAMAGAFAGVYSASEQLGNAARRLGDGEMRRAALRAALEAGNHAEAVLRDCGVHRFLHTAPSTPRFREDS